MTNNKSGPILQPQPQNIEDRLAAHFKAEQSSHVVKVPAMPPMPEDLVSKLHPAAVPLELVSSTDRPKSPRGLIRNLGLVAAAAMVMVAYPLALQQQNPAQQYQDMVETLLDQRAVQGLSDFGTQVIAGINFHFAHKE